MASAIILAGGENTRYGDNKALIDLGGKPLIKIIIDKISPLFNKVYVVTNNTSDYYSLDNIEIVKDLYPENRSTLEAIYSGLKASDDKDNMVFACDMPYLNTNLIQDMINNIKDYDLVMPVIKGKPVTFHTIYTKNCLPVMEKALEKKHKKVSRIFRELNVKYIQEDKLKELDPDLNSFFHIKTFVDYLVAQKDF